MARISRIFRRRAATHSRPIATVGTEGNARLPVPQGAIAFVLAGETRAVRSEWGTVPQPNGLARDERLALFIRAFWVSLGCWSVLAIVAILGARR